VYATIHEVIDRERAIITPSGPAGRPRRFVGLIKDSITEAMGGSVDQVDTWKAISSCRRGRRHPVPALKSKT